MYQFLAEVQPQVIESVMSGEVQASVKKLSFMSRVYLSLLCGAFVALEHTKFICLFFPVNLSIVIVSQQAQLPNSQGDSLCNTAVHFDSSLGPFTHSKLRTNSMCDLLRRKQNNESI